MPSQAIITLDNPNGIFGRSVIPEAMRKRQAETRFRQEWRMSKLLYECLMHGWDGEGDWRRFLQKMLSGSGIRRYGRIPQGFVQLTNHTVTDTSTTASNCNMRVRSDGHLEVQRAEAANIVYSDEWWSAAPETGVGSDYSVRQLSTGASGTWDFQPLANDVWGSLASNQLWILQRVSGDGVGSEQVVRTIEVGPQPSGPADDSCVMDLTVIIT